MEPMDDVFTDLPRLRAWAGTARPVLICGQARSGTSVLQLALTRHSALFDVPSVLETFVFRLPRQLLDQPPPAMLQGYLRGPQHLAELRRRLDHLAGGDATTLGDDDLIRGFFAYAAGEVYPGLRPLEKTPSHVHALARVFSVFPHAKVLACVREPLDVAESYRRRLQVEKASGKPPESWAWLDVDDDVLIRRLRKIDRSLRAAAAQAVGQVFQVPYRWLTTDPQAALEAICAFIGEPFEVALLEPHRQFHQQANEQAARRLAAPIGSAPVHAERVLTDTQRDLILSRTGGVAKRWRVPGIIQAQPE
jgi:hypothetical protein